MWKKTVSKSKKMFLKIHENISRKVPKRTPIKNFKKAWARILAEII